MTSKRVTPQSLNESYRHLIARARIDLAFIVLTVSAAGICSFGFQMNSPAVIVGAMVISPLLYPVIAVGVSIFWGDWATFRRSMTSFAMGLGLALLVSVLINAAISSETRSEIADRLYTVPTFYFIVAFLSGLAGAFAFFWPRIIEALAGICDIRRADPAGCDAGYRHFRTQPRASTGQRKDPRTQCHRHGHGSLCRFCRTHLVCSGLATWRMFFEPGGTAVTIRTDSAKNKRESQSIRNRTDRLASWLFCLPAQQTHG
jgi:Domain of unknown function (DUF389)